MALSLWEVKKRNRERGIIERERERDEADRERFTHLDDLYLLSVQEVLTHLYAKLYNNGSRLLVQTVQSMGRGV